MPLTTFAATAIEITGFGKRYNVNINRLLPATLRKATLVIACNKLRTQLAGPAPSFTEVAHVKNTKPLRLAANGVTDYHKIEEPSLAGGAPPFRPDSATV